MGLCDEVRRSCARIAEGARWVRIDHDQLGQVCRAVDLERVGRPGGSPPAHDRERHYLDGTREDVAAYFLTLDSINFGSGWFPTLRKRPGASGYLTVAWALAERFRADGPWSPAELRLLDARTVASVLGQDAEHELMALYAEALRYLGRFLRDRSALDVVEEAEGSGERLAATLARDMPFFDDRGFWKRAQITPSDLALADVASFEDLDRLTIFADNLVPHVLRIDGALRYDDRLAAHIDSEQLLPPGEQEREIRASAVHACELISRDLGIPPRLLDMWLWNRGQSPRYKAVPRHRTRTVYY